MSQTTALALPGKVSLTGLELPPGLTFEQWSLVGEQLQNVVKACMWWTGDWWAFGEHKYGERAAQFANPEGKNGYKFQTLMNAGWVSKQIETSRRREALSWSHHEVVAAMKSEEQDEMLNKAESDNLSRAQLRRLVSDRKLGVVREGQSLAAIGEGKYSVIYSDPPWSYRNSGFDASAEAHYPTMSTDEICAMSEDLEERLTGDAVLFMWTTNPMMIEATRVIEAWGFTYKTNMVWVKERATGLGFYTYGQHELLLLATRGSFTPDGDLSNSVIEGGQKEHSRKPHSVYKTIETMYPRGPYLELFLRGKAREGWTGFGNEVTQ